MGRSRGEHGGGFQSFLLAYTEICEEFIEDLGE